MRDGASYHTTPRMTMIMNRGRKQQTAPTAQIRLHPPQWLQIHSPIPATLLHPPIASFATTILDTTTTAIATTMRSSTTSTPNASNWCPTKNLSFLHSPQHNTNATDDEYANEELECTSFPKWKKTYDGVRVEISKQLSSFFAITHSFHLGTTMLPDEKNASYSFTTQMNDEGGLGHRWWPEDHGILILNHVGFDLKWSRYMGPCFVWKPQK